MTTQRILQYSHTVGVHAEAGRGFFNPMDVAIRDDGVMYVVSRAGTDLPGRMAAKRVTMCTVDEEYLGDFSFGGFDDGQIMWPVAIALDADENVYISDEALQCITIFDRDGKYLTKWGEKGDGAGQFNRPAGIAFDLEGNLLVVDGINCRVQRYTKEGRFLGQWGGSGADEGQFSFPWGITLDGSANVYVADWRNDRMQKFDTDGRFLASLGSSGQGDGQFSRPAAVAVDRDGDIYVADWGNERLQVLSTEGDFRAQFRGESIVSKWGQDYFLSNQDELEERHLADLEPNIDPTESDFLSYESGSVEKLFWGPSSVKIDQHDNIMVVESCRDRIQVFRKSG